MATIYDQYGKPIETQLLTREIAAPTLAGVRTIWTNQIASGLTPARLARLLQAAAEGNHDDYLVLAEEMEERNLHYAAELSKYKLAVSRLPFSVEAYSDSAADQKLADAVRDIIRRPGMRTLIKNLLDGFAKGFSAVEIMWDRSDATWVPDYKWRDPRFFQWDMVSRSELRLRDESNMLEGIPLAPYKFIVHRPVTKSGIPIRNGVARLAAWAFMCSGYTVKDWMAFAEVFGMPLRLGKYGSGASTTDIDVLKMAVANLGSDAAAVFPDSMMIELVESSKASGANEFFKVLAEYMDDLISKAILGQTSSSGGTAGKLGEEVLQAQVKDEIRDDAAEQVAETLNRDLVRPFIDLNFGHQKNYPVIYIREIKQENITVLSEALAKLVPLGLKVEQSVVRDRMGLPDPAAGAELLMLPAATQPPVIPADTAANQEQHQCPHCGVARNAATGADNGDDKDAVDDLVDDHMGDWEPVIDPLVSPVIALVDELVRSGGTLEDLLAKLADLYPVQDGTQMINDLAAAMLKARAMGDATDKV